MNKVTITIITLIAVVAIALTLTVLVPWSNLADTENVESISVRASKNDGAEVMLNDEQIADLVSILSKTKKQISLNVLNKDGWEYEVTITYTDGTSCKFINSGTYYSYDKDGKEVSSSRFWLYKSNYNKLATYLKTINF